MTVTVWWKSGKDRFTEFTNIKETGVSEFSSSIIYLENEKGNVVYVNVNEILYIEEDESDG